MTAWIVTPGCRRKAWARVRQWAVVARRSSVPASARCRLEALLTARLPLLLGRRGWA